MAKASSRTKNSAKLKSRGGSVTSDAPRKSKTRAAAKVIEAAKMIEAATRAPKPVGRPSLRSGFLIHDVSRLRRTAFDQRLKPFNITRAQWWVLANLARRNCDGISQVELARLLDVGKVTLGGLIDRLEESGFLIRVPDKIDRRSKRIMRSPEGKTLCERMEVFSQSVSAEIMAGISEEEHRQFIDVLVKMKHNLVKMDAVPQSTQRTRDKAPSDEDTLVD
jgi:MarR family transcriptional regulator, transcriptional regulator for hemolysin